MQWVSNSSVALGFHPSIKLEDVHRQDHVAMTKDAAKHTPLLYCVARNDMENLKPPDGEVANIIASSKHGEGLHEKQQPKCVEFPEMMHGWVSRGDTSTDNVKRDAEKALEIASEFLAHWMKE